MASIAICQAEIFFSFLFIYLFGHTNLLRSQLPTEPLKTLYVKETKPSGNLTSLSLPLSKNSNNISVFFSSHRTAVFIDTQLFVLFT